MKENIRKTVHAPIQVNNFMQIAMGSHLLSPKAAKQVGKKKSSTNVGGHLRRASCTMVGQNLVCLVSNEVVARVSSLLDLLVK